MKFKCLNAVSASIVLFASCIVNISNAGIIDHQYDVNYDGAKYATTYTGDSTLEQGGTIKLNIFAGENHYWNNMTDASVTTNLLATNTENCFVSPFGFLSCAAATRTGDFTWSYLLNGAVVSTGSVKDNDSIFLGIINTFDGYSGKFDQITIDYTLTKSTSGDANVLYDFSTDLFTSTSTTDLLALTSSNQKSQGFFDGDYNKIPEPTSLAIFALGIMGLATRRFKS